MPFSRIIEVDLATKQIVWKYQEKRESDFFSPRISNAQRLPNGNTLICEGDFGRLFEVTRDGELVWEFVNPYFGEGPTGPNNRVFRAYRYSEEEIARARATAGVPAGSLQFEPVQGVADLLETLRRVACGCVTDCDRLPAMMAKLSTIRTPHASFESKYRTLRAVQSKMPDFRSRVKRLSFDACVSRSPWKMMSLVVPRKSDA